MIKKFLIALIVVMLLGIGGGAYFYQMKSAANENVTLKSQIVDLATTVKELQKQLREKPSVPDTNGQVAPAAAEEEVAEPVTQPVTTPTEAQTTETETPSSVLPASAAFAAEAAPAPTEPTTSTPAPAPTATPPAPTALEVTGDILPSASASAAGTEEMLSVPLPAFNELSAAVRGGKTILPAVTPQFLANVPVASGDLRGSGVIDYDPNERGVLFEQIVRHNRVKGDTLETRFQGHGRPRRGDKNFLFNMGKLFFGQTDTNGHYEGSPSNGVAFNKPARVVGGYGVFVTGYKMAKRTSGKKVRVALNIVYIMREGAVVLRNPDVWNLREFFVAGNEGFVGMTDEDIYINEAEAFAAANNDRSYFALVVVPKGGIVDPVADRDRLLKENGFHSFSDDLPFDFVAAK